MIRSVRSLTLLGATGSIGKSTLDVVARHPDRFRIHALTAHRNSERLISLCLRIAPRFAVVEGGDAAREVQRVFRAEGCRTEVLEGLQGLLQVATDPESDTVVAGIVGGAGLLPTLAAVQAGKRVLLANKEPLVMAGSLFMDAVRENGAELLPLDSEHNAVFQCLPGNFSRDGLTELGVRRILLTASGGPFRDLPVETLSAVTPDQACAHPNWSMGRKISVDSATMMNKGLELIEACRLFGLPGSRVEVVVHPQSVIHSMVEYVDGSVLAQLGNPDMRTPIAHALDYPARIESGVEPLDLFRVGRLDFQAADQDRFPCLRLAYEALAEGGGACIALNAANEVAVDAFLQGRLGFTDIAGLIADTVEGFGACPVSSVDDVLLADREARRLAGSLLDALVGGHA